MQDGLYASISRLPQGIDDRILAWPTGEYGSMIMLPRGIVAVTANRLHFLRLGYLQNSARIPLHDVIDPVDDDVRRRRIE